MMDSRELGEGEKILFTLTQTRKGYVIEYFCAGFVLFLLFFARGKGYLISTRSMQVLLMVGIIIVLYAEISRLYTRYRITTKKIIIITGLLRQHTKSVYFHPLAFVPDINIEQNVIQRVFNFGTISVRGSAESAFEIKDIDSPKEVMQEIERLIDLTRVHKGGEKR